MCVKSKIGPSKIQGIGLFADEFISKGTVIFRFVLGFDLKFSAKEMKKLPPQTRKYLKKYTWLSKKSGKYCFSLDNNRYINHSRNPNALSKYYKNEEEVVTKAIKNIKKGEEITEDYRTLEKNYKRGW